LINIMIADDHVLVRKGIRALLASQADFQLVAEAGSYGEAVEQLHAHRADVVMLDISMPGRDGLDLIGYVRSVQPQARIIVLTMHTEDEFASRALKAGTHGYVTKDATPDQLYQQGEINVHNESQRVEAGISAVVGSSGIADLWPPALQQSACPSQGCRATR